MSAVCTARLGKDTDYSLQKSLNCERTITHPYGRGFVHQLEWYNILFYRCVASQIDSQITLRAPTGNRLLMRRNRSITLWDTVSGFRFCLHTHS